MSLEGQVLEGSGPPSPKAGYKSTEFWVVLAVAGFTLYKGVSGESPTAEGSQQVRDATAQLVEAVVNLVEVGGPIVMSIYYVISRGKLKSNTVRYLSELGGKLG